MALPHIKCCTGNGQGEFFVSPSIMRVVSEWEPEKIENATFSLESNGSLFTPERAMDENIEWFFAASVSSGISGHDESTDSERPACIRLDRR